MRITKCDRCGEMIEKCPTMRIKVELIRKRFENGHTSNTLDLCQKCEDEVYNFLFKKETEERVHDNDDVSDADL